MIKVCQQAVPCNCLFQRQDFNTAGAGDIRNMAEHNRAAGAAVNNKLFWVPSEHTITVPGSFRIHAL